MKFRKISLPLLIFFSLSSLVFSKEYYHHFLEQEVLDKYADEPAGVVIEFKGRDGKWEWVTPMIESYVRQIRRKYPDMKIDIVAHGTGIKTLTENSITDYGNAKKSLKSLSKSGVDVSVCGTKSKMMEIPLDSYAKFIYVAESAPALIKELKQDGYVHILAGENESRL